MCFPQYKPLILTLPTDKSAAWKIVNKGGAAKVKTFFVIAAIQPAQKCIFTMKSNVRDVCHILMNGNVIMNK